MCLRERKVGQDNAAQLFPLFTFDEKKTTTKKQLKQNSPEIHFKKIVVY